jgi:hypothetical protein
MGQRLEDLFGFVLEKRAEKVQVFNKVEASKVDYLQVGAQFLRHC